METRIFVKPTTATLLKLRSLSLSLSLSKNAIFFKEKYNIVKINRNWQELYRINFKIWIFVAIFPLSSPAFAHWCPGKIKRPKKVYVAFLGCFVGLPPLLAMTTGSKAIPHIRHCEKLCFEATQTFSHF